MAPASPDFEHYMAHLRQISRLGQLYKRHVSSPVLYRAARSFGPALVEVGSGTGSGCLGSYPDKVRGLEINPLAVDYCRAQGWDAQLIPADGRYPLSDATCDACILDNVLEHIADPTQTLDECHRITSAHGGLVIAVPGLAGYASDDDHKRFYGEAELRRLDPRWRLKRLLATPSRLTSELLSRKMRQYCLVAVYQKT